MVVEDLTVVNGLVFVDPHHIVVVSCKYRMVFYRRTMPRYIVPMVSMEVEHRHGVFKYERRYVC